MKEVITKSIGHFVLAPLSLLRGNAIANLVYRKGQQMVIKESVPYALDATDEKSDSLPEFFRPAKAFADRFDQVAVAIDEVDARNLLDIGCAEGYMISRAANEKGLFALGLEMDRTRIRVANAYSEISNDKNYGIVPASVGPELLEQLPVFDVVVCFSVLHHVIRYHGQAAAIEFLNSIRRITKHRFLFDMGSPEETANNPEWGKVLAFLKGDVVNKNKEMLEAAGFVDVRHVGDTPGYVQTACRPMFICTSP